MATDFEKTLEAKSDQINAADLVGREMTITITGVTVNLREAQKTDFKIAESEKLYRPCLGMRRLIASIWGTNPQLFIGRSLTIYRDPEVVYGGDVMGGIRISAASHIDGEKKIPIRTSRTKVKTYTVRPIQANAPAASQTQPVDPDDLPEAQAEAAKGTVSFKAWYAANPDKRAGIKGAMDELKQICQEADAAMVTEADPFGLGNNEVTE